MHAWGVDCGAGKVDIAVVSASMHEGEPNLPFCACSYGNREIKLAPDRKHNPIDKIDRLMMVASAAREGAETLVARYAPSVVLIEQPAGAHPKPTLMQSYGVICLEVAGVLRGFGHDPSILWMPPASWKARTGGVVKGNASKEQIATAAAALGYTGSSQDGADATLMALAALRLACGLETLPR